MLKYSGGQKTGKGTYWNLSNGERIDISTEGILPGGKKTTYFRLPASGILVLGPVLGLLYAAFLPFIGIAMLIKVVGQKIAGTFFSTAKSTASFGWRPSESYLAGKKHGPKAEEKKNADKPEKKEQ